MAEGHKFAKCLRSLEQSYSKSERLEQFQVTECFLLVPGGFLNLINQNNQIGKKYWDLETCRKSFTRDRTAWPKKI